MHFEYMDIFRASEVSTLKSTTAVAVVVVVVVVVDAVLNILRFFLL